MWCGKGNPSLLVSEQLDQQLHPNPLVFRTHGNHFRQASRVQKPLREGLFKRKRLSYVNCWNLELTNLWLIYPIDPYHTMNHTERFLKALFFIELYESDLWVRGCSLLAVVFKSRLVALSFWCFSCFWCFWYGALDTFEDLHLPFSITFKLSVSNCPAVSIPFVCKDRNFNLLKIGNPPPYRWCPRKPTARNHGWPRGKPPPVRRRP